ncbi:MAG: hypothetical protein ABJE10_10250 [bacterium]
MITSKENNTNRLRACLLIAAVGVTVACGGTDAPKVPLAQGPTLDSARAMEAAHALIGPAAKAQLDSGNAYYRKKAYADALARYRAASALAPQHAAPLFGIYMVARATHDSAMADSALTGIRLRNGPLPSAPHSLADSALQRMHEAIRRKPSTG